MNMTRIIRNTVYQVKVYNDRQDDISMEDAILRMIANRPLPFLREPLAPASAAQLDKAIV